MKLRAMLLCLLLTAFSFGSANAACYTTTLLQVNNNSVKVTDTAGAFAGRTFFFPTSNTTTWNQFLAVSLTALSAGKQLMLCTNSTAQYSVLTTVAIPQ